MFSTDKLLSADNVDTMNEMLTSGKLNDKMNEVATVLVLHSNTKAKKRTNDVRKDEDLQHYIACMQCWQKLKYPELPYDINIHFDKVHKPEDVMKINCDSLGLDYLQFLNQNDLLTLACVLATFGFNVVMYSSRHEMFISKGEIDAKYVNETNATIEVTGAQNEHSYFYITKCVNQERKPVKMKRDTIEFKVQPEYSGTGYIGFDTGRLQVRTDNEVYEHVGKYEDTDVCESNRPESVYGAPSDNESESDNES
jgi:hypothetical protein